MERDERYRIAEAALRLAARDWYDTQPPTGQYDLTRMQARAVVDALDAEWERREAQVRADERAKVAEEIAADLGKRATRFVEEDCHRQFFNGIRYARAVIKARIARQEATGGA